MAINDMLKPSRARHGAEVSKARRSVIRLATEDGADGSYAYRA